MTFLAGPWEWQHTAYAAGLILIGFPFYLPLLASSFIRGIIYELMALFEREKASIFVCFIISAVFIYLATEININMIAKMVFGAIAYITLSLIIAYSLRKITNGK
jgi:hypothetical protein